MRRATGLRDRFAPWTGLVVAVVAGAIAHQSGSEGVFNDCQFVSPIPLVVVALLAIAVIALGGFVSWRVASDRGQGPTRRLIGIVSAGTAALFVFALLLPIIGSLFLPRCFQ